MLFLVLFLPYSASDIESTSCNAIKAHEVFPPPNRKMKNHPSYQLHPTLLMSLVWLQREPMLQREQVLMQIVCLKTKLMNLSSHSHGNADNVEIMAIHSGNAIPKVVSDEG